MAYAPTTYTGNGSTTNFVIGYPFVRTTHVEVYLDDVLQASGWSFANGNTEISFDVAPGSGVAIEFRRVTPTTAVVDFEDAAGLNEPDLDDANLQHLYLAEETEYTFNDATKEVGAGNANQIQIDFGVAASRPAGANGDLYYSTDAKVLERHNGSGWDLVGVSDAWRPGNDGTGSGLDADKLDGVELAGVWHPGNDGTGSGLDADVVRGVTPGAGGLLVLDDANVAAIRTTIDALQNILAAEGDLIYATGADTPAVLSLGNALQKLRVNAGATAPEWTNDPTYTKKSSPGALGYAAAGTVLTFAHGLSIVPETVTVRFQCTANDGNFVVGDRIDAKTFLSENNSWGLTLVWDTSNVKVVIGSGGVKVFEPGTASLYTITPGKWDVYVRAWAGP
jgi:hypothetical protein